MAEDNTPTNVVDDFKLSGTMGGNTTPTGVNIAYSNVEDLEQFIQFDRKAEGNVEQINEIKKTILDKGYLYDTSYEGGVVFGVIIDEAGNVQIPEGNHRLQALIDVAKETGQEIYVPINPMLTSTGGGNKVQLTNSDNAYNSMKQLLTNMLEGNKNFNVKRTISEKLGEPGTRIIGLESYTYPGGAPGTSTTQSNIKKFFNSIGLNTITYDELPDNNIYKTGVNTFTDTPTNVVDDIPTLNTDLVWREDLGEEVRFPGGNTDQPRWKKGVVKKNNILRPNLRRDDLKKIIPQILDGTVSDIDFTRFGIWLMHHSPTPAYGAKPFSSPDALADVTKIVIFNGKSPIDLVNEDVLARLKDEITFDIGAFTTDKTSGPNAGKSSVGLSDELILQFGKEEGPFANAQQRMKQTIINEHNKLYANADDYFILFRGGALTDDPVQSFSKDGFQAWSVGLQTNQETIRKGRGIDGYFVNKNDLIDLHSLGLDARGEVEVIVYKEAVDNPFSKTVINPKEGDINYLSKDRLKFIEDNWSITSSELPKEGFIIPDTPDRPFGPGAAHIDEILNANTQLVNELPLSQTVKNQFDNFLRTRARNLATPGGAIDAVDVWELGVLGMMITTIALSEIDEIPTIFKRTATNMFNSMTAPYNIPPVPLEEYDLDYEFINKVLTTGEKVMPTDIIIKKVGDVVKGAAETGAVTGFGYVPPNLTKTDTMETTQKIQPGVQEEKMFEQAKPKKSSGGAGAKIL